MRVPAMVGDRVPRPARRVAFVRRRDHTLGTWFERLADVHGERPAVTEAATGTVRSFGDVHRLVDLWAGAAARRARPGSTVVVALPNGYPVLAACAALSRAGCVPVPVNPQMTAAEIDHVTADAAASWVLTDLGELAGGEPHGPAHPAGPRDLAALFYTSGTTGKPKGAELTHDALVGQVAATVLWPGGCRRDEAVVALPVAHIMGFVVLAGLAGAGIPVYSLDRFHPVEVLDALEQRRASIFVGVPAMYRMLEEAGAAGRDLRGVRVWGSGADVMPHGLARRFQSFGATVELPLVGPVGQAGFVEAYGMVEVGGGVAAKVAPPFLPLVPGEALGLALPRWRMRIVDRDGHDVAPGAIGEVWVKGPGVLRAYHNDPVATAEVLTPDGWLRTGDLARRGPLGSALFAGRAKHVVKHGGFSVYAVEVEAALEEHPDVLEAAVVGLPDETLGEIPAAAVRVVDGTELSPDALGSWVAERLAEYKRPRRIVFVEDLPRTGTAKVQRAELRSLFGVPAGAVADE